MVKAGIHLIKPVYHCSKGTLYRSCSTSAGGASRNKSVNGSSETMGCTSPLEDSDGVTVCRSQSYLVDGCSLDIGTSISDWAPHLKTVRRNERTNERTNDTDFAHVLLTFGFDTAVSPTGICS